MLAGTLELQLLANVARLREDMDAARSIVESSTAAMQRAADGVKAALAGIAAGLSVAALTNMVKGAVDAAAAMHDLSQKTGASVESLSALASVGKLSATSVDMIGSSMNKLAKNMASATEDGKGAAAALRAIGVDFNSFQRMAPDEKMLTLAKALDQFSDGSGKSAAAMALMGKEGANMLPFMKDLAQVGELQAKITTEQAAKADAFQDNLVKLNASGQAWRKELAMGMIPALDETAQAFLDVMNGTGGMRDEVRKLSREGSIAEWTRMAVNGLSYLMDVAAGVVRVFQSVGKTLGALWAAFFEAARGNFRGAWEAVKGLGADLDTMWSEQTMGQRFRERFKDLQGITRAATDAKKALQFTADEKDNTKEKADPFAQVLKGISERTAAYQLEIDQQGKLTEGQKLAVGVLDQLRAGTLKLTDAKAALLGKVLEEMLSSEKQKDQAEAQRKALAEAAKAHEDRIREISASTDKLKEEIQAQIEHNTALAAGKEASAALAAAKLEEQAASLELLATRRFEKDLDEGVYKLYLDQATALRELARAKREGAALEDNLKTFKSTFESIDKTAHDVWTNVFEGGSNAFKKLRDTLKATLLDLLYQMTVRPWIVNIVASMTGTPAAAAQVASGIAGSAASGGIGNMMSSGLSALGSSIFGGAGAYAAAVPGLTSAAAGSQAAMLAAQTGVFGAEGLTATAAAGGSSLAGALAAIPGWGWALAGAAALAAIFSKKKGGPKQDAVYGTINSGIGLGQRSAEGDAAARTAAVGIQQQYDSIVKALGGTGGLQFGLGYSLDPKGTSPTFVDVTASRAGSVAYSSLNRNAGRSQEELQAAIGQMGAAAILKGLQQSDIAGQIGDWLKSLGDIDSLSGGELQAALTRINNYATQKAALDEQMYQLTATDAEKTARAREQERAGIDETLREQYDRIQALKDEKVATEAAVAAQARMTDLTSRARQLDYKLSGDTRSAAAEQIRSRLAQAGITLTIDQILNATVDQFRTALSQMQAGGWADGMQALIDVSDAFEQLQQPLDGAGSAASAAADNLANLQETLQGLGKDLYFFVRDLKVSRAGTSAPESLVTSSRDAYIQDLMLARANDQDALRRIQQSATQYIEAQKGVTASGPMTQAVIDQVIAEISGLPAVKSYEEQNLEALGNILDALNGLPNSIVAQLSPLLAANFDKLDADMSGGLSFEELQTALAGKATDVQIRQMMDALDANGDGQITKLELLGGKSDTTNERLATLLQRIGTDSLLAYSASTAAAVFNGIVTNTGNTAMEVYNLGNKLVAALGGLQITVSGGAGAASTTYTPPPASAPPVVVGGSGWTPGQTTTESGNTYDQQPANTSLYQQAQASGLPYYVYAERMGYSYDAARNYLQSTGLPVFATGAAFTNGIVSRPTMFDIGMMGERDPEAIMPLANIGGSLGVRAVGGGGLTADQMAEIMRPIVDRLDRIEGIGANHLGVAREYAQRDLENGEELIQVAQSRSNDVLLARSRPRSGAVQ